MTEVKKCIRSLAVCGLILTVPILPNTGMTPMQFPADRSPFAISNAPSLEACSYWDVIASICITQ